jgi:hypothetical protein
MVNMDDDQEKLLFEVSVLKKKLKREREEQRGNLMAIYASVGMVILAI